MKHFKFLNKFIFLFLCGSLYGNTSKTIQPSTPIFVIVRSNTSDIALKNIFNSPLVKGVTFYIGWSKLNPKEGEYNFSALEKVLKLAKKSNKKINFGVLTGRWSPEWLKNKGVNYVRWIHSDNYVENGVSEQVVAPVPWDSLFNAFFNKFLNNLKLIIDKNEIHFNAIDITGGSNTNGIEVNFISSDDELKRIGFSKNKYIVNWEKSYLRLFPNITLTLAIHDTYGSNRTNYISKELIKYCKLKVHSKIKIAAYAFTDEKWFNKGNSYADLVLDLAPKQIVLQSIRVYSNKENSKKGFVNMIKKADVIQPAWLEIWAEDYNAGLLNFL
jgi:hypothetical protein